MINELKAICELQLELKTKPKHVFTVPEIWDFKDGAIPNIEAIFARLPKAAQDEVHNILVHQSKPGIVQFGLFFNIERNDGKMEEAFLRFYLKPSSSTQATAMFRGPIRVIDEEAAATSPSMVACLHVPSKIPKTSDDNGLYKFLRLAEGPAHLHWKTVHSGGKAVAEYARGTHLRPFVVKAVTQFVDAAMAITKSTPIGMGFVSIPLKGRKGGGKPGGGKGGRPTGPRKDDPPLVATENRGETTFKFHDPSGKHNGKKVKFESSYQPWTSGSSPWSKMAVAEFNMKMPGDPDSTHPITVNRVGGKLSTPSGNTFIVEVLDDTQFEVTIAGFDDALERVHRFTWA